MRYQDWDVLLFQAGLKVPIQEFNTSCTVVSDPDAVLQRVSSTSLPFPFDHGAQSHLPIVTSLVSNLPPGHPFRISLHSWSSPKVSHTLQNTARPEQMLLFEARVYIDGRQVSSSLFHAEGPWPHVIESSNKIDKNGQMELLGFPPFHEDLITQGWWDAGQDLGRIKVIIAEGIAQQTSYHMTWERKRNIVAFAFVHAPLGLLESKGIAYPNPAMWQHVHGAAFNARVMSQQPSQRDDHDAHAHSPQRRAEARDSKGPSLAPVPFNLPVACAMLPTPHAIRSRGLSLPGGYWGGGAMHSLPDPFFENGYAMGLGGHHSKESSSYGNGSNDDHSMPDYSHYGSANTSRSTSGVIARPDIHEEHVEHIHEVMGGQRDGTNGTKAPANTRQSSASNTPVLSKPSAACTARSVSHGQPPPRPPPANKEHDLHDESAESRILDQLRMHPPTAKEISDQLCTHPSTARENTHPIPRTTPTTMINVKQVRGEKGQVGQGAGPVTPCEADILLPASRASSCGTNSTARKESSFSVEYITINSSGSKRRMSGDSLPCPDSPTKRRVVSKGRLVSARCAPLQVAKEDSVVKDTKESPS